MQRSLDLASGSERAAVENLPAKGHLCRGKPGSYPPVGDPLSVKKSVERTHRQIRARKAKIRECTADNDKTKSPGDEPSEQNLDPPSLAALERGRLLREKMKRWRGGGISTAKAARLLRISSSAVRIRWRKPAQMECRQLGQGPATIWDPLT